jgi:hypothetical protein
MDPNFKLLLNEIKVVQMSLTNIDSRIFDRIDAVEHAIAGRFDKLEGAAQVFNAWKPKVDASMEDMRTEISAFRKTDKLVERIHSEMIALRKTVSRTMLESTTTALTGVLPPPLAFPAPTMAGGSVIRPLGHDVESSHRGMSFELKSLVKGTQLHPHPISLPKLHRSLSSLALVMVGLGGTSGDHGVWHREHSRHEPRPPWETNHQATKFLK